MNGIPVRWFLGAIVALTLTVGGCSEDSSPASGGTGGSGGETHDAGNDGEAGGGTSGEAGGPVDAGVMVTAEPVESMALFANPGMGWQTFHSYADSDPDLDGLPSGSAYFRFTWKDLEPTDGDIEIDRLGSTLERAREAGQTLMFRVMTAGSDDGYAPDWLESAGCKVFTYAYGGATLEAPDLDDPMCWARFETLMTALGSAFGAEPDLQVDIGGVGLWGEWHFSSTDPEVPMPSAATRQKVVDLHLSQFPHSPQTALIGDVDTVAYATGKGTGWRADCLGDLGFFSDTWNHMDDMYKQHVQEAGAQGAWEQGPVAWESCGVMQDWVDKGYDVHDIFAYALEMHGSFLNNKSSTLPAGAQYRSEVERLLETLGYRLVMRSLTHPAKVRAGDPMPITMAWENKGVAPPYHPFGLQVRMTPPAESTAEPVVLETSADVRTWLPGPSEVSESLSLPGSMPAGTWTIAVGITGTPGVPMLNLAIEGRDAEGWYPVSAIEVE